MAWSVASLLFQIGWCFIREGLHSLETPRVVKGVSRPPHTCDSTGVSWGVFVNAGCVELLSLGTYLEWGHPL